MPSDKVIHATFITFNQNMYQIRAHWQKNKITQKILRIIN
jgi:hypothetical protein